MGIVLRIIRQKRREGKESLGQSKVRYLSLILLCILLDKA